MIQSPLNYTGGKFKLLPQILPLFPQDISLFVDLFCGGCNVGINVDCKSVIYNDLDSNLLYLYNTFKNLDKQSVFDWIYQTIERYDLSLVSSNGYDYYNCDINLIDKCRVEWQDISNDATRRLKQKMYFKHDINYRLYRSWEDFDGMC